MKIKPNHINIAQIIKKCFNPLFITLLVLAGLIISPATVLALPEPICTCAGCGRPCGEGHKPGCQYGPKNSGSGSTYSGGSPDVQMMQGILQPFFNNVFAVPDTSVQDEINRQNTIKQQQEEEQKKQAAIKRWVQLQNEEAMKRRMEQEARIKQGEELLSQIQTIGGGGTPFFGLGGGTGSGAEQGPADGVYIGNGTIPTLLRKSNATTEEEWKLAREWQARIDELVRKHSLSPAEAAELGELERKRNSLWKRAIGVSGLTAEDREALRLRMHFDGSGSVDGTFGRIVQAREDVTQTGTNGGDLLMLDMTQASLSYGIGSVFEHGAEEYVVNNLGERAVSFGDASAVGGAAMAFAQGNKEAAVPPAINWLLGKIPSAAFSVGTAQGVGEVYTTVFRKSWDRFVTEVEKVVPGTLPPGGVDQFWDDMKRDLTTGQRCFFEWGGY